MTAFSRRHFIKAGSVLASLPLLPAAAFAQGSKSTVDVRDYQKMTGSPR